MELSDRRKKVKKFKESAWKCIYFFSGEAVALYVTHNEPWFTNTKYFWVGPGDQTWPDVKIKSVRISFKIFVLFSHQLII